MLSPFEALKLLEGKAGTLQAYYQQERDEDLLIAAHATWLQAVELIHSIRTTYLAEGSKHQLIEKVHPIYEQAIEATLELYSIKNDEMYLEDALMLAESSKSVLLYLSLIHI